MVEIYLCRHGQSLANAQKSLAGHIDSPLTETGRRQAQQLGELAKNAGLKFDCVYTSPLSRARDTAKIISAATGSPEPRTMKDLIERDFGVLTGRPYSDIAKLAKKVLRTDKVYYFLEVAESETFPQTLKRAQKILNELNHHHHGGKVLLVTHGDIGMMLFAAFHNSAWKSTLAHFNFENSELLLLREDLHHKPHVFSIDQFGVKEKA